jgi:tRNA-Thr(GGU) m(6)t(6)A37 methyltransferase TsaA
MRFFESEASGPLAPITLDPIGVVRSPVRHPRPHGWEEVEARIVLRRGMAQGLMGLEGFSHIFVLFFMHLVPAEMREARLQAPLAEGGGLPVRGVFATRSQLRPNPIGLTVCRLLRVRGHVLWVRGLDAIDGTPVLDIKPYLPPYDAVAQASMPPWVWERGR